MQHVWPEPSSRDVGVLTDPALYGEALQVARQERHVSAPLLQRELGPRLRGQFLLQMSQSQRVTRQLVAECQRFGWLQARPGSCSGSKADCFLTEAGATALDQFAAQPRAFRRTLVAALQAAFVIPGWLVDRLWRLNPRGQGEVILPGPPDEWLPRRRIDVSPPWTGELEDLTRTASARARAANPLTFPIEDAPWVAAVRQAWERPRTRKEKPDRVTPWTSYSPRRRLAQAMRRAAVGLIFDRVPPGHEEADHAGAKPPFYLASFEIWCARLTALELAFYTDWQPAVEGRILFPLGVFRSSTAPANFERLPGVEHPDGRSLYLHQPQWPAWRETFWQALVETHRPISQRVRARYVSLLDVRDEVCRQYRLSPALFEEFLERALAESPPAACPWYLSAETDLREDLTSGPGLLRRPVYVRRVPHTLLAVSRLPAAERSQT